MIELKQSPQTISSSISDAAKSGLKRLMDRNDLGFFNEDLLLGELKTSLSRIKDIGSVDHVAVLGIGGSSLGAKSVARALLGYDYFEKISFFENIDSFDFDQKLNKFLVRDNTHFIVISKSGETLETLTQLEFLIQKLKSAQDFNASQFTCITGPNENSLRSWAKQNEIHILDLPESVGGRFSVLTCVGLFPLGLVGADIQALVGGAIEAKSKLDVVENLVAETLCSFEDGRMITCFWVYSSELELFGAWVQQLWAESLAKRLNRDGESAPRVSTPLPLIGANDQHSILQQIVDGEKDKFVWFMFNRELLSYGAKLEKSELSKTKVVCGRSMGDVLMAEALATRKALHKSSVPSLALEVEKVNGQTLGALIMTFELVVGALGEALNINAFDQPGVEEGKKLAMQLLMN